MACPPLIHPNKTRQNDVEHAPKPCALCVCAYIYIYMYINIILQVCWATLSVKLSPAAGNETKCFTYGYDQSLRCNLNRDGEACLYLCSHVCHGTEEAGFMGMGGYEWSQK